MIKGHIIYNSLTAKCEYDLRINAEYMHTHKPTFNYFLLKPIISEKRMVLLLPLPSDRLHQAVF